MLDPIHILIVDDEQRNLDTLEAILDDPSYRLLFANDADKALKHLLENDVAAIVLDIKMPGVSGFELAQIIKGTRKFREIPIVFLTAYMVDDQDILAGYGAGAVDYLTKPVKPQILRHKIGVFAELFRKTRALAELNATLEERVQQRTAELERSEAELRDASKQKDAFLATLAHELRNPLAPLRMGVDLLVKIAQPTPGVTRALGAMNRQLDHMVRLIDDLLDVSRISRGMLELKRQNTDLAAAVESAMENARPFADQRSQTICARLQPGVYAFTDPTRICQVIGNLLHNASKYTPSKGEIEVELSRQGGSAVIRVIDPGAGIPVGQIDHVFDMFARIERDVPSSGGGLGIGLAIARQLAEMHGGSLRAESAGEGLGSLFTLELPVIDAAPAAKSQGDGALSSGSLSVVVIEDNDDSADMLAAWLEDMGHAVTVARNGPDGVTTVRDTRPRIVFCDIGLPGMDGVEVCKHVTEMKLPVRPLMVALTGWGMDSDRKRTTDAGFDHHLVKPVDPDKLRAILRSVSS